jgi:hypothetical protein
MSRALRRARESDAQALDATAVLDACVEQLKRAMDVEDCSRGAVHRFVRVLACGLVGPQHLMCPLGHDGLYCGLYAYCTLDQDAVHRFLVRVVCDAKRRFGQQQQQQTNTRFGPLAGRRSDMGYMNLPRDVFVKHVAPHLSASDLSALAATCSTLNEWACDVRCAGVAISVLRQLPPVEYDQDALLAVLHHAYDVARAASCVVYTAQCRARLPSVLFAADLGEASVGAIDNDGFCLYAVRKRALVVELGSLFWAISFQDISPLWLDFQGRRNKRRYVELVRWTGSSEVLLRDVEELVGLCSKAQSSLPTFEGLDLSLAEWSAFCGQTEAALLQPVARELWPIFPRTNDIDAGNAMMRMASKTVQLLAHAAFGADGDFHFLWLADQGLGADGDQFQLLWLAEERLNESGWVHKFRCNWSKGVGAVVGVDRAVEIWDRFFGRGWAGTWRVLDF